MDWLGLSPAVAVYGLGCALLALLGALLRAVVWWARQLCDRVDALARELREHREYVIGSCRTKIEAEAAHAVVRERLDAHDAAFRDCERRISRIEARQEVRP